jgi:hypothetical protein
MRIDRNAVAALVGAGALLVSGGTALAQGGLAQGGQNDGQRGQRCEELLARVAEKRGVSVAQLEAEIKAKLIARIDAALAAGRISPERAAKLKERISSASLCPAARAAKAKLSSHSMVKAAADFLGLSKAELRQQLPGTSLGALAQKQGKSVADLKAAMLAPAKARLARAVSSEKLTQARADARLARLGKIADRLIAKVFPAG